MWNCLDCNHHSEVSISCNGSGAKMSVLKGSTDTPGLLGIMNPYYIGFLGILTYDGSCTNIWDCTDVFIYDNQCESFGYTSTANKRSIICHEVGHALSLAHEKDGQVSIMAQHAEFNLQYTSPQTLDDNLLKLKWGY